ncbi:MAG: diguanylate cyclase [Candidatus Anammoxibacter sp.]
MNFDKIFDMINIGVVVLDKDLKICFWNPWMETHSGIDADEIKGSSVLQHFPNLNSNRFLKNVKSVITFGNLSFFSQKLHRYLFPFKPDTSFGSSFEYMQQSCTMGPMKTGNNGDVGAINHVYIIVQDVTELVGYEKRLLELNTKDGLTGAYNRRFLDARLKEEFERHRRYSRPMSFILIDIDFFKQVNDNYGHLFGDFVLKSLSARINTVTRNVDIFARYGGEEFCCLVPETTIQTCAILAEKIRLVISGKEFTFEDVSLSVTISLGISEVRADTDSANDLIKKADEALYRAKESGRNRAVLMN